GGGVANQIAILVPVDEGGIAGLLRQPGDAIHRPVERLRLPVVTVGRAIEDVIGAVRVADELERGGPLGTQRTLVDGAAGVALDVDALAVLHVGELRAADGTVRADAVDGRGAAQPRVLRDGDRTEGLRVVSQAPESIALAQSIASSHVASLRM